MKFCYSMVVVLLVTISTSVNADVFADQSGYAQIRYGTANLDDAWYLTEGQQQYRADIERVREIGFGLQLLRGKNTGHNHTGFEYGIDINLGYVHDHRPSIYFYSGDQGSSLRVEANSRFRSAEIAAGGFVALKPVSWARLYMAAGPGLYWGRLQNRQQQETDVSGSNANIIIDTRNSRDDWQFGLSARAGVDLLLPRGIILGGGVKYSAVEFDFNEGGEVDLSGAHYFVTLGSRF